LFVLYEGSTNFMIQRIIEKLVDDDDKSKLPNQRSNRIGAASGNAIAKNWKY